MDIIFLESTEKIFQLKRIIINEVGIFYINNNLKICFTGKISVLGLNILYCRYLYPGI